MLVKLSGTSIVQVCDHPSNPLPRAYVTRSASVAPDSVIKLSKWSLIILFLARLRTERQSFQLSCLVSLCQNRSLTSSLLTSLISNTFIKSWFGACVTPNWWNDIWI